MSQKINIESLNSILETVNSLPDAGSGGGGSTASETCTVTLQCVDMAVGAGDAGLFQFFSVNSSNDVVAIDIRHDNETIDDVKKDSLFVFRSSEDISGMLGGYNLEGAGLVMMIVDRAIVGIPLGSAVTITIGRP